MMHALPKNTPKQTSGARCRWCLDTRSIVQGVRMCGHCDTTRCLRHCSTCSEIRGRSQVND